MFSFLDHYEPLELIITLWAIIMFGVVVWCELPRLTQATFGSYEDTN